MNGKTFRMDGYVVQNLDLIKKVIKNDWDFVYVVDGEEGSGKSAFAQQLAYYVTDGHFGIDDIVFTVNQFKERVRNQKKFRAVVWDEAFVGMDSKSALNKVNKEVTRLLMECRQRNLFIFIVMPTWWDLTKYATLHRSKGTWHVHTDKNLRRGYFRYYKKAAVRTMYLQASKLKYSNPPKYKSFYGRFPKGYMVDELEYRNKKETSFKEEMETKIVDDPIGRISPQWKDGCINAFNFLKHHFGFTYTEMSKGFGVNYNTVKNGARPSADKNIDNCAMSEKILKFKGDNTL